jgi:CheY-like chemotaxis protein
MADSGRPLRLLLVDDEPDTVATLAAILEDEGHSVARANSAMAALAVLRAETLDAVIADINLRGPSGYELGREVQRMYRERGPLMIAISGMWKGQTDRLLSQLSGFEFFLEKPCEPHVLLGLLAPLRRLPAPAAPGFMEDTAAPL